MSFFKKLIKRLKTPVKYWKIRQYELIEGWMTVAQARLLTDLISKHSNHKKNYTCVEIGSWQGKSTFIIGKSTPKDALIYAVDPFDGAGDTFFEDKYKAIIKKLDSDIYSIFLRNMNQFGLSAKVKPIIGYSTDVSAKVPHVLDCLFIDGNHEYDIVKKDFHKYATKLKPNGLLLFHDVDFNPFTSSIELLKTENSENGIYGPSRVIQEFIVNSNDWYDKQFVHGMFYCFKK